MVFQNTYICRLQRVQNTAARIVTLTRKYDSITPIMFKLHWLPVHSRIIFKLLLLVYKALNGKVPSYISSLLSNRRCSRSLHSNGQEPFTVPLAKLKLLIWADVRGEGTHDAHLRMSAGRLSGILLYKLLLFIFYFIYFTENSLKILLNFTEKGVAQSTWLTLALKSTHGIYTGLLLGHSKK